MRPSSGGGPGCASLLLTGLLLGGTVVLIVRFGVFSDGSTRPVPVDTPSCPVVVNRWANERLALIRRQLERESGFDRANVANLNAIGAALHWIDARIIDQRVSEARQQIRTTALTSSRCLVQFDP